jgi:hypothetical protein
MTTSTREAAIAALFQVLDTARTSLSPAPTLLRNETVPQNLPAGGVMVLQEGETEEATGMLSPLAYAIRHRAELEITVGAATEATRISRLEDILGMVSGAIVADRTLSGAVEWAEPGSPLIESVPVDGASALRSALLPITLWFTATGTPLG